MPPLDRDFWRDALSGVHALELDPDADWKMWALEVLRKAEERIGSPIPRESHPEPEDKAIFQRIVKRFNLEGVWATEKRALDQYWHGAENDVLPVDNQYNYDVFFLLYRLIEKAERSQTDQGSAHEK